MSSVVRNSAGTPGSISVSRFPQSLKKAVDSARAHQAPEAPVKNIASFWNGEFSNECPYDPRSVCYSKNITKFIYVPNKLRKQDDSNHLDASGINTDKYSSQALKEDIEVMNIRAALLVASRKGVNEEGRFPVASSNTHHVPISLVRGTRTTLAYAKDKSGKPLLKRPSPSLDSKPGSVAASPPATVNNAEKHLKAMALFNYTESAEPVEVDSATAAAAHSAMLCMSSRDMSAESRLSKRRFSRKILPPSSSRPSMIRSRSRKINEHSPGLAVTTEEGDGDKREEEDEEGNHVETFEVGDNVEARYRGRKAYLPGKITRVLLNGTYDIQYLETEEKGVPAEFIRKRVLDVRRMKTKLRISGMLVAAMGTDDVPHGPSDHALEPHQLLEEQEQEEELEAAAALSEEEKRHQQQQMGDSPLAGGREAASSRPGTGEAAETTAQPSQSSVKSLLKSSLSRGISLLSVTGSGADTSQRQRDKRAGGISFKQNTDLMAQLEEREKQRKIELEISEKIRLWTEMRRVVAKFNCEIDPSALCVKKLLGRGKFSAVHEAAIMVSVGDQEVVPSATSIEPMELVVALKTTHSLGRCPCHKSIICRLSACRGAPAATRMLLQMRMWRIM